MSNSPIIIRKFNPLHCGERGLIYSPLSVGFGVKLQHERFTNPTFSRIRKVYNSDLLSYSRFTHMSSVDEGCYNLRVPPRLRAMKIPSTKVLIFEFVFPGGRSSPSARWRRYPPDRRPWSLRLRFRAAFRYLRSSERDIPRPEGHGLRACAPYCSSETFGYAWLHFVVALQTG